MSFPLATLVKACEESARPSPMKPGIPFVVRLVARCGFEVDPDDPPFVSSMVETTKDMVRYFGAVTGYTYANEILLAFPAANVHPYGGRVSKIVSLTASYATARFCQYWSRIGAVAMFESRCVRCSSADDAVSSILWRLKYDCHNRCVLAVARSMMVRVRDGEGISGLERHLERYMKDRSTPHLRYGTVVKRTVIWKRAVDPRNPMAPLPLAERHVLVSRTGKYVLDNPDLVLAPYM